MHPIDLSAVTPLSLVAWYSVEVNLLETVLGQLYPPRFGPGWMKSLSAHFRVDLRTCQTNTLQCRSGATSQADT